MNKIITCRTQEINICTLYKNGVSTKTIGHQYACSADTIRRILNKYKLLKTKPKCNKKIDLFNHIIKMKNGCWEWQLSLNGGYGQFSVNGKMYAAHVLAYEINNKLKIPNGLLICHTCDNPKCINPEHLFLGTVQDNRKDCVNKNRQAKGIMVNTAKLTENNIINIRKKYKNGMSQNELAKVYGVSQNNISNIVRNKTWKHIKELEGN